VKGKIDKQSVKPQLSVPYLEAGVIVHLRFLQQVGKAEKFADPEYLLQCRDQYFKFLKLLAKLRAEKNPALLIPTPAVDVWWQAHLIRPSRYQKFCLEQFGSVLDRDLAVTDPSMGTGSCTKLWDDEYKEKYEDPAWNKKKQEDKDSSKKEGTKQEDQPTVCIKGPEPKKTDKPKESKWSFGSGKDKKPPAMHSSPHMISVQDVIKDREWYPHLKQFTSLDDKELMEEKFLQKAFEKYKCFLHLCSKYPKIAKKLVPPQPIDLFWHVHQMFPLAYSKDCSKLNSGFMLDHNPWPDCAKDKSRELESGRLWQEYYGESLWP
jgi:hypothetical protein